MTSYKTLLFGTIAFVCAASPALADVPSAVPGPVKYDVPSAVPGPTRNDVPSAVPGPSRNDVPSAVPGPSRFDVPSAVPKYVVIAGIAGLPAVTLDMSWFQRFIGH
jgi:hypothetical protein